MLTFSFLDCICSALLSEILAKAIFIMAEAIEGQNYSIEHFDDFFMTGIKDGREYYGKAF